MARQLFMVRQLLLRVQERVAQNPEHLCRVRRTREMVVGAQVGREQVSLLMRTVLSILWELRALLELGDALELGTVLVLQHVRPL